MPVLHRPTLQIAAVRLRAEELVASLASAVDQIEARAYCDRVTREDHLEADLHFAHSLLDGCAVTLHRED